MVIWLIRTIITAKFIDRQFITPITEKTLYYLYLIIRK